MPWKECSVMDERLRFVARLLEGDGFEPLGPRSFERARAMAGSYGGSVAANELPFSCFQNATHTTEPIL